MAKVCEESSHVWSSKQRTVMFLAAMRHLALALQAHGRPPHCTLSVTTRYGGRAVQRESPTEFMYRLSAAVPPPRLHPPVRAARLSIQASGCPLRVVTCRSPAGHPALIHAQLRQSRNHLLHHHLCVLQLEQYRGVIIGRELHA